MATFLDLTVFGHFNIIFSFLLVYVIVYGTLVYGKFFGNIGSDGGKGLYAIIALGVSAFAVMSPPIIKMITFIVPWFFIVALVIFLILFTLKMFTGDKVDFSKAISGDDNQVRTWVIVFAIVILIFGFGKSFGSDTLEQGNWNGTSPPSKNVEYVYGNNNDNNLNYNNEIGVDEFIDSTGVGNEQTSGSLVATNDFSTNVLNTIVNPKVLGMILILLVAIFAMFFLAD